MERKIPCKTDIIFVYILNHYVFFMNYLILGNILIACLPEWNCRQVHNYIQQKKYLLNLNCRFQWLTEFLDCLRKWKESTERRAGNFTQNARTKMFLSWQTHEGFLITVNAVIEVCKFLLHEGMEYVLMERFCQDPVEEYFGNQRKLGRRSDNPDIRTFGFNDNTIRIQRTISCQSRNTRGRKDKRRSWEQVTDVPILSRKKSKSN